MKQTAKAFGFLAALLPSLAFAQVQNYPQTLPPNTLVGRLGNGPGPSQAIPFSVLLSHLGSVFGPSSSTVGHLAQWGNTTGTGLIDFAGTAGGILYFVGDGGVGSSAALTQYGVVIGGGAGNTPATITPCTNNQSLMGNTGAAPACRALLGADLPNPSASTLGGVQSIAQVAHQWIDSISTSGVPHLSQPAFADLSGTPTTLGGYGITDATPSARNVSTGCGLSGGGNLSADRTLIESHAVNAQTGTSYAILNSDCGKIVTFNNASSVAASIAQAGSGGNFAAGWKASFQNLGAGVVTITPTTSTINGGVNIALSQGQGMDCYSDGSNYTCQTGSGTGGGGGGVSSFNGRTGSVTPAANDYTLAQLSTASYTPGIRLTLTTGVPVMQSGVAGATTVYATPVNGGFVPIYDGTKFTLVKFAEVSQATTDTTKSPAAVAASSVYGVVCWVDSGTNRCTRTQAWTNTTTPGFTYTSVDGILLNTSSITNGPAALRGTWVGNIASNASSTIDNTFGAAASGGTAANMMICSAYNQVPAGATATDNGSSYNNTTPPMTPRLARASSGNQINFLNCNPSQTVFANIFANTSTGASGTAQVGIGCDSTSVFATLAGTGAGGTGVAFPLTPNVSCTFTQGVHFVARLEAAPGGTNTYDNGVASPLFDKIQATIWN
jgi:hypothetical protein